MTKGEQSVSAMMPKRISRDSAVFDGIDESSLAVGSPPPQPGNEAAVRPMLAAPRNCRRDTRFRSTGPPACRVSSTSGVRLELRVRVVTIGKYLHCVEFRLVTISN
jgi:hypothetical protein